MYEVKDFTVQITFADDVMMGFEYENFTLAEVMSVLFKDAKEAYSGVFIDSIEVTELGI